MKLRSRDKPKAAGKPLPAKKDRRAKAKNKIDAKRTATTNSTAKTKNDQSDDKVFDGENPDWFSAVHDKERREGFLTLHRLIRKLAPDLEPTTEFHHGLIGYGPYHYKYKSGREGDHARIILANNKQHMALHCCCGLLKDSGKYVVEKGLQLDWATAKRSAPARRACVRFQRLSELNHRPVLEELIAVMATCDILH